MFVLSSCGNLTDGGTTLTLLLSEGKSVTYTPLSGPGVVDISQLTYIIHGSGPGILSKTVQGGGSITLSLVPGNWTIQVTAKYGDMLYAESEPQSVNVQAGGNNAAAITIGPAWSAGNTEDFGGDPVEYKYFSASDAATSALESYIGGLTSGNYVVIVDGTHTIGTTVNIGGGNISLRGPGNINCTGGSMFTIPGGELILRGPTLQGGSNGNPLVQVTGGTLTLREGAIKGHTNTSTTFGGGVSVSNTSIFNMYGGSIDNNHADSGGGVLVSAGGTFTMYGGTISDNKATTGSAGGVFVYGGIFTMNGGSISSNTAVNLGGGAYVYSNGIFTMNDGDISGNTVGGGGRGGGVNIAGGGKFKMSGGIISGSVPYTYYPANTAPGVDSALFKESGTSTATWGPGGAGNNFGTPGADTYIDNTIHIIGGVQITTW
ncbi:hypothetical protein AGMMS50230_17840 [Spirochaetia bacterium]|nr:hypothetical protein AGMMS50230_17840 [Spirochaetia bacterium]